MLNFRNLAFIAGMLCALSASAESVDGVIVDGGENHRQFAIAEVKEITFDDGELTIVKTDDTAVTFAGEWVITFGPVEFTGIEAPAAAAVAGPAKIYTVDGALLRECPSVDEISVDDLPSGIYIIESNGKSLKIKR